MFGRMSKKSKVIKEKTRILMFGKGNRNCNVSKDTARFPRYTGIGAQFQSLPIFETIRA